MTPKRGARSTLILAGAATLTLAVASGAWAQALFYQEAEKDGRIYVFAIAKEHDNWTRSGEMGKAITRLGYGPTGETVIFDSEAAIGLYNFKHGKPGEAFAEPKRPKLEVAWKDGKTSITTDNAQLQMSNRIQARWTQELPDDTVQLGGTPDKGDPKGSFRIRRVKMKFEGWFYKKELTYEVQLNWPDVNGSPVSRFMEDANINWDVSKKKSFMIKFGQYKVPFGRQEITSSGSQQFVDRSDVSLRYARGRETGLQLWGQLSGGKLEWRAGVFNGNGRSQSANDNDKYQYNARLVFAPKGDPKYSEGDFESKDKPLWAVGASFESNDKFRATSNIDTRDAIFGFDGIFKYKGFSLQGEYFTANREPEEGAEFTDKGYYVQAGYLLGAKRNWELAARYGDIDPSDLESGDSRKEVGGALGHFYNKHNLKVQADFRQLEDKASGVKNKELRLQTQLIF